MKWPRREGKTLSAGSAWTKIASYFNDSDVEPARIVSLGHCYHDNSLWRLTRDDGSFYIPEWDIQIGSMSYPFGIDLEVAPKRGVELWAKNNDVASHVYEGVLIYEGTYDQRAFIGSERCEKTFGMTVTTLGDISTDLIPAITNTYKLGSATKFWLDLYLRNLYADTLKSNLACDDGVTIDGIDLSAADPLTQYLLKSGSIALITTRDHHLLTGLLDDDHTQYALVSEPLLTTHKTATPIDHPDESITAAKIANRTRYIALQCLNFYKIAGVKDTWTWVDCSGSAYDNQKVIGIAFDPATDEMAFCGGIKLPEDFVTGNITFKIVWNTLATDVTKKVYWFATVAKLVAGSLISNVGDAAALCAVPSATARTVAISTLGTLALTAGDVIAITVWRYASHASDTCAVDANFIGLILEYTADS